MFAQAVGDEEITAQGLESRLPAVWVPLRLYLLSSPPPNESSPNSREDVPDVNAPVVVTACSDDPRRNGEGRES